MEGVDCNIYGLCTGRYVKRSDVVRKQQSYSFILLGVGGVVLAASLVGCDRPKKIQSDEDKYSYAIGHQVAQNLKSQNVQVDPRAFAQALKDNKEGKAPALTEEEMRAALEKLQQSQNEKQKVEAEANKKKGEEFLEANKAKEGIKVTESGLQYRVLTEAKGQKPKDGDTVVVHYKGTLIDGTEFDSSYKRDQPAEFPVDAVIPGWTEALKMMSKGSKYELFIPPNLAYGERGRPSIPANSVLQFEVELIDIKKN